MPRAWPWTPWCTGATRSAGSPGPACRRAFQRIDQLRQTGLFANEPVEIPVLLRKAFEVAEQHGVTMPELAEELRFPLSRLRLLLGDADARPALHLV